MKNIINLVDEKGNRIGLAEKLEVHTKGLLHEAFSIFVFNENNELLIQRRNLLKYHSGGLWSNTCCSHPSANENINSSIHRRLKEEMGFDCELKKIFSFLYKTSNLGNDLIEYEYDHVFKGQIDEVTLISPDPNEVSEYRWIGIPDIEMEMEKNPELFTEWFKIILKNENFLKMVRL
jgi:isopentenyl-diphosphate delta-isomerase